MQDTRVIRKGTARNREQEGYRDTRMLLHEGFLAGRCSMMDFSNMAGSQKGGNTFQGGERDKRKHSPELGHGKTKRFRVAPP